MIRTKTKDPDAILFYDLHYPEQHATGIEFLKFDDSQPPVTPEALNEELPEIYKWLVLLLEPDKENDELMDVVYHEAGIGDPAGFVENQIRAKSEGLIVKKCGRGFSLLVDFLRNLSEAEYANLIDTIIDDWSEWCASNKVPLVKEFIS